MSNHTKALEKIKELVEKYGKGGYIFRGTTRRYSLLKQKMEEGKVWIRNGINSNLYRWVVKEEKKGDIADEQENLKKIFSQHENFSPADMEKEIAESVERMFPSNTANHEIITELQHFGGKTNMIDFSRSMYVGLFFACQGNFNKNGELLALREGHEKFTKSKTIDYDKHLQEGAIEIIDPAGAQSSRQRVHFQSSVFVRPADGYINRELCEIEKIDKELKKPIMEYLQVFHNLTENTIYNDLHGFIMNEKNNETASLYFYMGLANANKDDYEKAIVYYSKCIEKDLNSAMAYNNRGDAYFFLDEYALAVDDYSKAISLNPEDGKFYNNRGDAYFSLEEHALAVDDYSKAISLDPEDGLFYNNRGDAYFSLEEYYLAVADYSKAIWLNPEDGEFYNNRGDAYFSLEEHALAVDDYSKAISLNPEDGLFYNNRGDAYSNLEKYALAVDDYSKAISLNPEDGLFYNNRGNVYSNLEKYALAVDDYSKAISLDPKDGEFYFNRGSVKEKMGDAEGAKTDFEKAKELGYTEEEEE